MDEPKVIYAYTREQAIKDGVFVDVTSVGKSFGLNASIVMTQDLHKKVSESQVSVLKIVQQYAVCAMLRVPKFPDQFDFIFTSESDWKLRAYIGPGTKGELTVTLMLAGER